ncbi:MAG: AAA family ATPase [Chloroflexi bacterium]|nr:AAA family ATPase [Chloroflexota bacterium]
MPVRKARPARSSPAPVAQTVGPQYTAPPAFLPDQDRLARLARLRVRIAPAGPGALPPPLPASWLVRGLLPAGSVALLVGDSAARKTYLMLHLALHVSQGLPWLGHPVRPAPVLYFDEDLGAPALRRRLALLARGLRLPALPGLFTASFNNWRFPAEGERDLLHYLVLERRAGLVVLDPLSGLAPFGLENDPRRLLHTFDQLRHVAYETGVAVVLVHHLNKRGAFRGVSHLKALADVLLHVHSQPLSPVVHLEAAAMRGAPARRFSVRCPRRHLLQPRRPA